MVVIVLLLVWVVALVPLALRKRSQWRLSSSIAAFRGAVRVFHRFQAGAPISEAGLVPSVTRPSSRALVAQRQARRRRTLVALGSSVLVTLVFGAIPSLRVLWDLTIVAVVLLIAYLGLLVHFARLDRRRLERSRKVVPFRLGIGDGPSTVARMAVGSDTPSNAALAARPLIPLRPAFVIVEAPR